MSNKFFNEELINKFENYRNCIFYNPLNFTEVYNNNFELQTFSKTFLTKFMYKHSQKDLSNEQIKKKLLKSFCNADFINFKQLDNNLVLTNNKYPYVSTNNNKMFIIWDIDDQSSISDIKNIVDTFFGSYNYLLWRNPFIHQSVKLIKHYHLVIRKPIIKPVLKKVLLVVRHGPREPIHLPKNFNKSYWSSNFKHNILTKAIKARMTCLGKLYCWFRGQEAKKYYENEINFKNIKKEDVLIKSSYIERTIESAIYYMRGFDLYFEKSEISLSNYLVSNKLLSPLEVLGYELFQNNFNIKLNVTKLSNILTEITGEEFNSSMDIFHLCSTIKCYKVHDYELPKGIDDIYNLLEQTSTLIYNKVNEINDKNIYSEKIGSEMLNYIFETLKEKQKFIYLSTHDNMIMALLKYISHKYNLKISLLDIPDFCSCIRFEIWNNDLLRIYYDSLFLVEIIYK